MKDVPQSRSIRRRKRKRTPEKRNEPRGAKVWDRDCTGAVARLVAFRTAVAVLLDIRPAHCVTKFSRMDYHFRCNTVRGNKKWRGEKFIW